MESIKIKRNGLMLVLSSPSGAGKTTLSRRLLEVEENISMSISVTTRNKRPSEIDGRDYYFLSKEEFNHLKQSDMLLEDALVFDNYYGTPKKKVFDLLESGNDVLFDIDWQGTANLAQKCKEYLVSIFILPPSMKELESRLKRRAEDSEEIVNNRMSKAKIEISKWNSYDYIIVNENIDESLNNIRAILRAERLKRSRCIGLKDFIDGLIN